jgi:hypothetical protein
MGAHSRTIEEAPEQSNDILIHILMAAGEVGLILGPGKRAG